MSSRVLAVCNFDKSLLHINGYHCIFQRNTRSAKGGLVIYLSDEFEYDIKLQYASSDIFLFK